MEEAGTLPASDAVREPPPVVVVVLFVVFECVC